MKKILQFTLAIGLMTSCGQKTPDETEKKEEKKETASDSAAITENENKEEGIKGPELDTLKKNIKTEKARVENLLSKLEKKNVNTAKLREQIKQKWARIEYYLENKKIVRIKTYPYEKISTRTEEFYFKDGKLMLAFIKDKGVEKEDLPETGEGKTYFFKDGAFAGEENESNEPEYTVRASDAERLMEEADEYLEIFEKN